MMKQLYIILFFIIIFIAQDAAAKTVIGYGTADSVYPKPAQELVLMGFEAGFKRTLKKKVDDDFVAVDFEVGGTPLGAVKSAQRLMDKGARILIGFPTSHEALLVSKFVKEHQLMAIFSNAGHTQLANMGDNIYTVAESIDFSIRFFLDFMKEKFPQQKGLILINPKAVFSASHVGDIQKNLKEPTYKNLDVDLVNLNMDLVLSPTVIKDLKQGRYKFMHLTMYAEEAIPVLRQLNDNHIDIPIVGSGSWDESDIDVIRRYLFVRKSPTYGYSQWKPNSPEAKDFENIIKDIYNREPTGGMTYGYDLGVVIATTLNRIDGEVTLESFKKAFKQELCFKRASNGTICFSPDGGHAQRKIYMYNYKDKFAP